MTATTPRLDYGDRPADAKATDATRRLFRDVPDGHALVGYDSAADRMVYVYPWVRGGECGVAGHTRAAGEEPAAATFEPERVAALDAAGELSAVPLPDTPAWVRLPATRR